MWLERRSDASLVRRRSSSGAASANEAVNRLNRSLFPLASDSTSMVVKRKALVIDGKTLL